MMDTAVKLFAAALCIVLVMVVLRRNSTELILPAILAGGGCILWISMDALSAVGDGIARFAQVAQMDSWMVKCVGKVIGISLLSKLSAELCRSVGEGGVAAFVDTAGTLLALACTLPLAQGVVEMVVGMLS